MDDSDGNNDVNEIIFEAENEEEDYSSENDQRIMEVDSNRWFTNIYNQLL